MKLKHLYLAFLIVLLFLSGIVIFPISRVQANPDTLTLRPNANGTYSQFVEVPNSGFIFGDQFESGDFSAWTGLYPGTPTIGSDHPHTGTYSIENVLTDGMCYESFSCGATIYCRGYFRISAQPSSGNAFYLMYLRVSGVDTIRLSYHNISGTYYIYLEYDTNGDGAWDTSTTYATTLSVNTYYCLEVKGVADPTNGEAKVYLNGASIVDVTGLNQGNVQSWDLVEVGFFRYPTADSVTGYCDDVVVSKTGPIGVENRASLVNGGSSTTALQVTANTTEAETEVLATTAQTGTISNVQVNMVAYASTAGCKAETLLYTGTSLNKGASQSIANGAMLGSGGASSTSSFVDYYDNYATDPDNTTWTWAEVNAIQIGAQATTLTTGNTIQFSEFYIIVDYESGVTPPTYSLISTNTTVAGALCSFNCLVSDDANVSTYTFSTNNTGTWTNDTATTFSNFFNTTAAWANVTKTLNDTVGNVVSYLWYANDTSDNWSSSDQYNPTLTTSYRPSLQITPDNVTCRKYLGTFTLQINVTNAVNTQAFNFTIYYDSLVLNCSSVSSGELANAFTVTVDNTNGIVEVNAAGLPVNGNRWMMNITFQAINATIWKEGLANKLEGKIWFHQALLGFADGSTLQYVEGGVNQIGVNSIAYTFLPIPGDVNNDGTVDVLDLRTVAAYYGKTSADPEWLEASKYDLTNDNIIDIFDLVIVAANYGFTSP